MIAFVYVYVAVVVAVPMYWAVRWERPMECDLVYILEVRRKEQNLQLLHSLKGSKRAGPQKCFV